MSRETFRERYRGGQEPVLNALVDAMAGCLLREEMSSPDLARCAVLATQIYAERYNRPLVVCIEGESAEYQPKPIPGLYDDRHRGSTGGSTGDGSSTG